MKKYLIIFLISFGNLPSFCQEAPPDSLSRKELRKWEKAHNIIDLSDQLSIRLNLVNKTNQIKHHDGPTQRDVLYKPNEITNLGVGLGYKWIGLDVTFNSPSRDDEVFGKTKRFDFQSNIYMHKFVVDVAYQWYRGYYGSNPESYDTTFTKSNPIYPIRPDIKTQALNLSGLYIFNHKKFSYRHAFTFNEIQKRSMGSFIAGAYFSAFKIKADSSLIPTQLRTEFDTTADFRGTQYINLGITVGYAYNLILFRQFYISTSLSLGTGPAFENIPALEGRPAKRNVNSTSFILARAAIGYNGNKWFAGLSAFGATGGAQDENKSFLERQINNVKLHVGFRIPPPKILKRIL